MPLSTMIAVPIADTVRMKRMTEFAADVTRLADQRPDLDLHALVDDLHADLLQLQEDR
jgi:hypothetical protein